MKSGQPSTTDLLSPLSLAAWEDRKFQRADHLELLESEVLETLQPEGPDILVAQAPPRHGKSQFLSRKFATWFHCVYPDKRSIIASYGLSLARGHSRYVRDRVHMLGPCYDVPGVRHDVSGSTDWEIEGYDGGMLAAGIGGGITGRGADLFIVDDYLKNSEQATSERIRDSQWEWMQTTAHTRLEPGGKMIVLATRWHEDDLIGKLLKFALEETSLSVREVRLPALAEPTDAMPDPLGRATDEALWPSRISAEALKKKREIMEPYWWNAMYQQRLGSYGHNEWPTEYFYGIMAQDDEWPETFNLGATALDPSKGKNSKSGDYSAIVFVGFVRGYLWIDASIERRPVPQMVADLVEWNKVYRPTVTGIEAVAFQELLLPAYASACEAVGMIDEPVAIDNTVSKSLRIGRLGTWLRMHRVKIRNTPGGRLLVKQMKDFPNGDHDDGPDAMEMAIRLLCQLSEALDAVRKRAEFTYTL